MIPAERPAVAAIVRLGAVESTQAEAFRLAAEGAPDRTVVIADYQSAGRGRRGRVWEAEPGAGLLASIVVRPVGPAAAWPLLSLVTSVAVAETLARLAGLTARLKWPNDVLVGGRKIAGILLESRSGPEAVLGTERLSGRVGATPGQTQPTHSGSGLTAPVIIIGVGINVSQRAFPRALADQATSIWLESGGGVDRDALLAGLLGDFDAWRGRLEREGFGPVRERWLARAETIGRMVTVDGLAGLALDLDAEGALLVRAGTALHRVRAGEVHAAGR